MAHMTTAEEAYLASQDPQSGIPRGESVAFACPHCRVHSQQNWGYILNASFYHGALRVRSVSTDPVISLSLCQVCGKETIFVDGKVVYPQHSDAPMPSEDMPKHIAVDYLEARQISSSSPRGAAALLRLAIQKLCPVLGATKTDINAAIAELVQQQKIPPALQQALDSVRVIGNEAVHPGTIDLNDSPSIAHALFGLVNFIVEKGITEPRQIGEIYASLPAGKLAGIAQRDKSTGR